jgi:hypothetical protein
MLANSRPLWGPWVRSRACLRNTEPGPHCLLVQQFWASLRSQLGLWEVGPPVCEIMELGHSLFVKTSVTSHAFLCDTSVEFIMGCGPLSNTSVEFTMAYDERHGLFKRHVSEFIMCHGLLSNTSVKFTMAYNERHGLFKRHVSEFTMRHSLLSSTSV